MTWNLDCRNLKLTWSNSSQYIKCMGIFSGNAAMFAIRLSASIYNKFRSVTYSVHLTDIMITGNELQANLIR